MLAAHNCTLIFADNTNKENKKKTKKHKKPLYLYKAQVYKMTIKLTLILKCG